MHPAGKAGGRVRAKLASWDDGGAGARRKPDDAAEIRQALGVESAFGFHVEEGGRRPAMRRIVVRERRAVVERAGAEPRRPAGAEGARAAGFPCLDGVAYAGCLGAACPLETCWTGAATVSYARKMREEARVSAALYLPGAPCHTCAELVEDEVEVPAPRAMGQPGATRALVRGVRRARRDTGMRAGSGDESEQAGAAASAGAEDGRARGSDARGGRACGPDAEDGRACGSDARGDRACNAGAEDGHGAAETVTLRRVNCARGLWQHPISLSAFLMKRIPMLDQDEPEQCPGYSRRPDPHPEVVAYLQRRRERARLRRQDRRAAGEEA